ncbi:MAG: phosphatase PAP2 family protein [Candidatus Competibacteraceae bacterium]
MLLLMLAFIGITVLTGLGILTGIDRWSWAMAATLSFYPVDLLSGVFSFLGNMEVTGLIALVLALHWRRRYGWRGFLAPLLLFVGVAIEIVLKYALFQPPLPPLSLPRWQLPFSSLSLTHAVPGWMSLLPYSFPSGHLLRSTFLISLLMGQSGQRYRLVGVILIAIMAFTRVYDNDHWLSDVIGGCLLGLTLASLAAVIHPAWSDESGIPLSHDKGSIRFSTRLIRDRWCAGRTLPML